jgi:hypothetical protein
MVAGGIAVLLMVGGHRDIVQIGTPIAFENERIEMSERFVVALAGIHGW